MKLGFAFLLLTCALLFPQAKPPSAEDIIKCHQACDKQVAASLAACQKAAKNDAQKKACEPQAQALATFCFNRCPSPPKKN